MKKVNLNNDLYIVFDLKDSRNKFIFLVELIIKKNYITKVDEFFAFFFYDTNWNQPIIIRQCKLQYINWNNNHIYIINEMTEE